MSICIPTFDGARHLAACLDSALQQTYQDFEILIVDDHSSDRTMSIASRYANRDPRVRVERNPQRLGLAQNWDRCIGLARGEWVKFLFQDDLLDPACLEKLLAAADSTGSRFVACRRDILFEDPTDEVRSIYAKYLGAESLEGVFRGETNISAGSFCRAVLDHMFSNFIGEPTAVLVHRSVVDEVGKFNADLVSLCDLEYWIRIGIRMGMVYVPEILATFRVHESSASAANRNTRLYRQSVMDPLILLHEFAFNPSFAQLRTAAADRKPPIDLRSMCIQRALRTRWRAETATGEAGVGSMAEWDAVASAYPKLDRFMSVRVLRLARTLRMSGLLRPTRWIRRKVVYSRSRIIAQSAWRNWSNDVSRQRGADSTPLRVLFVSHSGIIGGAELSLYELVKGIKAIRGAEPGVVFPDRGPLVTKMKGLGIPTWITDYRWWATDPLPFHRRLGSLLRNVTATYSLFRFLRITRPDLIVTNTITIPAAAFAARLAGLPHVWHVHELGAREHGLFFHWGRGASLWLVGRLSKRVIVPSRFLERELSRHIPRDRLRAVREAPETQSRPYKRSFSPGLGPLQLVLFGQKSPGKGQEEAIRAVALLRDEGLDVRLSLVGWERTGYVALLRQLVTKLGVGGLVEFVDYKEDHLDFMDKADVVLMCSRLEGFSRVIVEAMKCGRPVVAARSGAAPELVTHGRTGLLYTPGDAADLAGQIRALKEDWELAERLSDNAKRWASRSFSSEKYATEFMTAISEGLSSSPLGRSAQTIAPAPAAKG